MEQRTSVICCESTLPADLALAALRELGGHLIEAGSEPLRWPSAASRNAIACAELPPV